MSETNGGGLTTGQRLERIEAEIRNFKEHTEDRITRHREINANQIKELAKSIIEDFGERVTKLEMAHESEERVKEALEKYQAKQTSTFRWVMGFIGSLGLVNLILNLSQGAN